MFLYTLLCLLFPGILDFFFSSSTSLYILLFAYLTFFPCLASLDLFHCVQMAVVPETRVGV